MPGIDGLDLQRRLVAERAAIPVILMTGDADVALVVQAMEAGAVDCIEKPFDSQVMIEKVETALAQEHGEREREQHSAELRTRMESLSAPERQVLDGLVAGKSNKSIAY